MRLRMSDETVLEYRSKDSRRALELAASWLMGMGCLYGAFGILGIVGIVVDDSPREFWQFWRGILEVSLMLGTWVIWCLAGWWLRRGEQRGIRLAIWMVVGHWAWIGVAIGEIMWETFGGVVDPGVPLFGMGAMIVLGLFGVLCLGPLFYYLVKVRRGARHAEA